MDEDRLAVHHKGIQRAVIDHQNLDAGGAQPGRAQNGCGQLGKRMFDICITQQTPGRRRDRAGQEQQKAQGRD